MNWCNCKSAGLRLYTLTYDVTVCSISIQRIAFFGVFVRKNENSFRVQVFMQMSNWDSQVSAILMTRRRGQRWGQAQAAMYGIGDGYGSNL